MDASLSFVDFLKAEGIKFWPVVTNLQNEGLILIDEENHTIILMAKLKPKYPNLHRVLKILIKSWLQSNTYNR